MNILFVTLYRINKIDESSIYHDLIKEFRDNNHSITVISPTERRYKEATTFKELNGVKLLNVKTLNITQASVFEKGIGTLLIERQFIRAFKKYLKQEQYDVIIYSTPPINLVKLVLHVKNNYSATSYLLLKDIFPQNAVDLQMMKKNSFLYQYFRSKEIALYKASDFIGCMSPRNRDYLLQNNLYLDAEKVEINPNTIKINPLLKISKSNLRKIYGLPIHKKIVVYGGNLGKPQSIDTLLDIIINDLNSEIFYIIIGSGTEERRLKNWFNEFKPVNAMFLGYQVKEKFDELISCCDAGLILLDKRFTIPNFPSRLLTYMERQLPVMTITDSSTDIGLITEKNQFGVDLSNYNLEERISKIYELMMNQTYLEEMGRNSRLFLEEEYSVSKTYQLIRNKIILRN